MTALPSSVAAEERLAPRQVVLPVYSVTPFTMLDFPGKTACIIWFTGCNMRCPYCHNPQIVKGKGRGDIAEVINFLKKRQGLLDGVVLSGGEASAYPDVRHFMRQIKSMGYAVKLDTNGLHPDIINNMLDENLLDYVALDYKAPAYKFKQVTGTQKSGKFLETLHLLCHQRTVPFEVRTTVHTDLLDTEDVQYIINDLCSRQFSGTYAIQNYRHDDDRPTLGRMRPQRFILPLDQLDFKNLKIEIRNF